MSENLNKAAKCFVLTLNDKPVAFMAILPFPHGHIKNGFRISRIVVLPDYQGLGLGFEIIDYFGAIYAADNKTMYIKTSNPALFGAMSKNTNKWMLCSEFTKEDLNSEKLEKMKQANDTGGFRNAITKSYKYIGPKSLEITDVITFNADAYIDVAQNQISMFLIILTILTNLSNKFVSLSE